MKEIGTDFQGGPIYALTLKEILQELGAKLCISEDCGCGVIGFNEDDPILDLYPRTLEDDGMGYGVNEQLITAANYNKDEAIINIFVDKEH